MTLLYHEEGTAPDRPFVWIGGMLVRPSDIGVTSWGGRSNRDKGQFWWNMLGTSREEEYRPAGYLQERLAEWQVRQQAGELARAPFVTALIHENNFYRSGAEGWTLSYFSDVDKQEPLAPPYDLNAPDPSVPRTAEEQAAIWAAYEEMVAWSAENAGVVTSEDIVEMAQGE